MPVEKVHLRLPGKTRTRCGLSMDWFKTLKPGDLTESVEEITCGGCRRLVRGHGISY